MKYDLQHILKEAGESVIHLTYTEYTDPITGDVISTPSSGTIITAWIEDISESDRLSIPGEQIAGDATAVIDADTIVSKGDRLLVASGQVDEREYEVVDDIVFRYGGAKVYKTLTLRKV